ncbi:hypothetical protein [Rhizomicrobium electricum]|jgi:hypothetical protein|nr:hypothetical protein [Rhizomicrobium electricum]NIJ48308.1 hypothetical protein [Rhizomicrobium electricum]
MHGTVKSEEDLTNATGDERPERVALLAGLVIDSRGGLMVPSGPAGSSAANARYYVSAEALNEKGAQERIPSSRLDTSVTAMLRRVRLLEDSRRREDLTAVLRRVVVLDDAIILQLDKRQCLATWREKEAMLQRLSTGDVLRLIGTCLAGDEEITEAGTALCLRMPRHTRARKIRSRGPRNALLFQ